MLYHLLRTKAKQLFTHLCLDEKRKVKILCAPWLQKSSYHSLIIEASTSSPHPLVTVPRVSYTPGKCSTTETLHSHSGFKFCFLKSETSFPSRHLTLLVPTSSAQWLPGCQRSKHHPGIQTIQESSLSASSAHLASRLEETEAPSTNLHFLPLKA